jgi:hypothetical protein
VPSGGLLHIRNPWGTGEWTGRYSKESPMWQVFFLSERLSLSLSLSLTHTLTHSHAHTHTGP